MNNIEWPGKNGTNLDGHIIFHMRGEDDGLVIRSLRVLYIYETEAGHFYQLVPELFSNIVLILKFTWCDTIFIVGKVKKQDELFST